MKNKCFIIAEIGINHNGDVDIVKKLILEAYKCGCNAVKFQKRTIDTVYTKEDLDRYRESPWGTTNRQQKYGLEFGTLEYNEIDQYCKEIGIEWFASAWDIESQKFLRKYNLKYNKVASPMLTNRSLLEEIAGEKKYTFVSTGMSTLEQIENAINIFKEYDCPFELMHCNSTYPLKDVDVNLSLIPFLKEKFDINVGYSGHENGTAISVAAVALGATSIERHITLDRTAYGSDQAASLEIGPLRKMVECIRKVEVAIGEPIKEVTQSEMNSQKKLRRVNTL